MVPQLPNEAEWDIILLGIAAWSKEQCSILEAYEYARQLQEMADKELGNVEAFEAAFSDKFKFDRTPIKAKTKEISEQALILASKVVMLRKYIQERGDSFKVDELIKNI